LRSIVKRCAGVLAEAGIYEAHGGRDLAAITADETFRPPKIDGAAAAWEAADFAYFAPRPNKRGSPLRQEYHIPQRVIRHCTGLAAVVALMLYYFTRHGGSG
jgi:hypothetical protein